MNHISQGYFPLGGIFRAERHFLLFKDQLAKSGRQKTKENITLRGKFRLVENDPQLWKFQKAAFYPSNFMRGQSFVLSVL